MRLSSGSRVAVATLTAGVLALTGCGGSSSDVASDPGGTATSADGIPSPEEVVIVDATAARGRVDLAGSRVDTPSTLADFTAQFRGDLGDQVSAAVAGLDLSDGRTPYAAVVGLGCDVPPSVGVTKSSGEVVFVPAKVTKPLKECFAPVTTVAVAAVG